MHSDAAEEIYNIFCDIFKPGAGSDADEMDQRTVLNRCLSADILYC